MVSFIRAAGNHARQMADFRMEFLGVIVSVFGIITSKKIEIDILDRCTPLQMEELRRRGVSRLFVKVRDGSVCTLNGYVTVSCSPNAHVSSSEEITYGRRILNGMMLVGFDTQHLHDDEIYGEREVASAVPIQDYVMDIVERTVQFGLQVEMHA